jgi:hypothetical protein
LQHCGVVREQHMMQLSVHSSSSSIAKRPAG